MELCFYVDAEISAALLSSDRAVGLLPHYHGNTIGNEGQALPAEGFGPSYSLLKAR